MEQRLHFALTSVEKNVLYKKYKSEGLSSIDADLKLKTICNHLRSLVKRLMKKELSDEEINQRFKEELEKLLMRY